MASEVPTRPSRRGLLAAAGGLVAAVGGGFAAGAAVPQAAKARAPVEPFFGAHQGGIVTPAQDHTYLAAFDLRTTKREDVMKLLRSWTDTAARMSLGAPAAPPAATLDAPGTDSDEALGLTPARLTVTFGFGAGLFEKAGKDRYGLAVVRPAALVDLPRFNGDQLVPTRTGGDLSVQACSDDPMVAFHAVRQLSRLAYDIAEIRWTQSGFQSRQAKGGTPRNLMGFKDGTHSPPQVDPVVWVGTEGPAWMQGGSYVVVRRIRMALEHWDRTNVGFQEQTLGRHKVSGAPLGLRDEFAPLRLDRADKDGNPIIPENAHVRLANAASNGGAEILRRGYSYNDGVNFTAERWPPWRQGMEYDAGLLFVAYQRDPRTGFVKIFENMAKFDMLNQFVTHTGGGLFACPGGVREGEFVGQRLFVGV
ncbi:MAG TPA: iron uptake transporter deferrochelatase/peroxidase subunit [Acetobacteraceae bacterium]|jgi:deferrochelatase/peroxidase EfeB|nr:iron uptake transporter deferrochelatase/peroxidase subunit [Acetobacteraceae bacterium]